MMGGLSADHGRRFQRMIDDLVVQAEADGAVLCDEMGHHLAQTSFEGIEDVQGLTAVAAGTISATKELARLLGERCFEAVFHRGATRSLYFQSLPGGAFLAVVFSRRTTAGIVKHYIDRLTDELAPLLRDALAVASVVPSIHGTPLEMQISDPFLSPKETL